MATLQLKDGYDRRKEPRVLTFRTLTPEEAKEYGFRTGDIWFESRRRDGSGGAALRCRANGQPKTWKRRDDVELPVKYGLKECARAVSRGDEMVLPSGGRLLVLVSED